ncbi:MAG TPA: DUF3108 domain-containing protein [Burkholderiales bacterium]|nr:DUF3108 domain-containing protein [Burkholderiales bacterium]
MMRNCCFLLLSLAAAAAHAEPPARLEVAYELQRNGSAIADVVERLEYAKGSYQLTETWKGRGLYSLLGSARRVSQGTIAGAVLRPREFFDERSGRDTARAWFDWKANVLTMQYKGERKSEPLYPDGQDRLSFLLALSLLPGSAQTASYHIADGKGISHHRYQLAGHERVRTPAGEFDTVRVDRIREPGEKDSAQLWLAEQLGYIPVRLLDVEKDGTSYDQLATRVSRSW